MAFAMIFPGQASQYVGMLSSVAKAYPSIIDDFQTASDVLGYDLWSLSQQGPKEKLDQTTITQPAVLTASVAMWNAWVGAGGAMPSMVAGHSLGEYSALVAAGVLSFKDALQLVVKRAQWMAQAGREHPGKMLIVLGLVAAELQPLCEQAAQGQVLSIANYNSEKQLVVAGEPEAIERLAELARDAGARRVMPAAVSVASHCDLMQSSQEPMRVELSSALDWCDPSIPVIQNASLRAPLDTAELQRALVDQLVCPVKWVDVVAQMRLAGASVFVECGPAKVLTGLMKRMDKEVRCYATDDTALFQTALDGVKVECIDE